MTAKEYLEQLIVMDKAIKRKQQRLETLRGVAMNTTPSYSSEGVQCTREKNPLENIMIKIVDLDREIERNVDALVDLKAEVWEQLDKMSNERYKRILWLRYAERRNEKFIATNIGVTTRHVRRLYKLALDSFEKIFLKNKKCPIMSS